MDAAQRRFDAAQSRFDRERDIYERERAAFEDARARYEDERRRLAYSGPTWRSNDGQTYCRRKDGTVGTIIGGVAGALLGRAVDGGRRSAVGTIIGGGAGALAGRSIEKNSGPPECR
ncbi:MAG: glycine zipper 2TM domain-containing protein [Proteobacteria bacterium]|nr:glycine zipper 2TM domain-containing protein [Pseudomonadota bacterium]